MNPILREGKPMARTVLVPSSLCLATLGLLAPLSIGCSPDEVSLVEEGLELEPSPSDCGDWAGWLQNVEEGLEVVERADSSALAVQALLFRIRARALRASSEVTNDDQRDLLHAEFETLADSIDLLAHSTAYDGTGLTDGSVASWEVTVSDDTGWGTLAIDLADLTTSTLGVDDGVLALDAAIEAQVALDLEQTAREEVEAWRSSLSADRDSLLAFGEMLESLYANCESGCDCCDTSSTSSFGAQPEEAEAGVLEALVTNLEEAIELVEVADLAGESIEDTLEAIRELAVESSSEELADDERAGLQDQYEQLSAQVDRLAAMAMYNEISLLDGRNETLDVQVGNANTSNERVTIVLSDLTSSVLGVDTAAMDLSSATGAQVAIDVVDTALDTVATVDSGFDANAAVFEVLLADVQRQME